MAISVEQFHDSSSSKVISFSYFGECLIIFFKVIQNVTDGLIRDFLFVRNEGIYVHVCGFTIRTDESSVMIDENTFLMCVDGVKNLLFLVFFDIGVESTTLTSATTILDSDLLIDGAFEFKFSDEFKFFFTNIRKQHTIKLPLFLCVLVVQIS